MTRYIAGMVINAKPGDKCPCCYRVFHYFYDRRPRAADEDAFVVCHGCGAILRYVAATNSACTLTAEWKKMLREYPYAADIRAAQEKIVAEMIG